MFSKTEIERIFHWDNHTKNNNRGRNSPTEENLLDLKSW